MGSQRWRTIGDFLELLIVLGANALWLGVRAEVVGEREGRMWEHLNSFQSLILSPRWRSSLQIKEKVRYSAQTIRRFQWSHNYFELCVVKVLFVQMYGSNRNMRLERMA